MIIVGCGVAGMTAAHRLAEAGISVIALDAGPRVDRNEALRTYRSALVKNPESPFPNTKHAPYPTVLDTGADAYYVQDGPDLFKSTYLRLVGGTTWHWLGTAIRLLPSDFRLNTEFGVGVNWPISYEDLEPWYVAAEAVLGVAGSGDLGSPRSAEYPMQPIPLSYSDLQITQAIAGLGHEVTITAQARNTKEYDGRPACCGAASCIPLCPIVARYEAAVHVAKAEAVGVEIIDNAVAHEIELDGDGLVSAIVARRPGADTLRVTGRLYVLAAHAIETAKLLLMSRSDAVPEGVANQSDQVGRNLMDHPIQLSWAVSGRALGQYRGPLSTAGIDDTRALASRDARAAFRVEFGNDGWTWPAGGPAQRVPTLLAAGLRGSALATALAERSSRELRLSSMTEQLPDPSNRVVPDFDNLDSFGLPRPRITYSIDSYTRGGLTDARAVHGQIFAALEADEIQHRDDFEGAGHVMGTYRMGADPAMSVVDVQLRAHQHPNLFMLGSGVFPTGGTANPTLTIVALALRAAATIIDDLPNW
ncbi:Glucose-methanol-choline (GMC) oxidoreductase:NAD binding site [Enhygromyxa salina]|uniref:Glucose-methanol-choline (GMC) oxidoreductase:NAD binding site n=1 Tax=Enhygromyxa salina TaxID=215803 RepID=A0A0C2DE02_9BACT|nr:Glucose-methanol-choline (GMC) oxidoreductase:NAD binding site [Enhygromyxa salina]